MNKKKPKLTTSSVSKKQKAVEDKLRQHLSVRLAAERATKGWTQEELAERAHIHWTTVSKVERGRQIPSLALLLIFGKALGVSLNDLMSGMLPDHNSTQTEDATIDYIRHLPTIERENLLELFKTLIKWKNFKK